MGPKRILIVEDEEVARTLYKRLLDRLGYVHDMVASITEARERIAAAPEAFDLLVTDLRLPDGRGTDVLEQFHGRFPKARILIVTGSPELTPSNEPPPEGAEWLYKPFELDDFLEAVKRLLSQT